MLAPLTKPSVSGVATDVHDVPACPNADRIHNSPPFERGDATPTRSPLTTTRSYDFDASGNLVSKLPSLPIIGDLTSGSSTISSVSAGDIAQLYVGAPVAHAALPSGTTVSTISSTSFTVNHAATGNVTAASITLTGESTTYSWDEDNRLTQVGLPASVTVSYSYDVAGRMLTKKHSVNGTTRYEWDGMDIVREYGPSTTGSAVYDSAYYDTDQYGWNGTTNYYIVNGVLRGVDFDGGGTCAVVADAMGHVRALVDSTASTVFSTSYSTYGEAINITDSTQGAAFPMRYVGAHGVRWEADTGLTYMRQRWYRGAETGSAGLQRFIARDPLDAIDKNVYRYCYNQSVKFIDPMETLAQRPSDSCEHRVQVCVRTIEGGVAGFFGGKHASIIFDDGAATCGLNVGPLPGTLSGDISGSSGGSSGGPTWRLGWDAEFHNPDLDAYFRNEQRCADANLTPEQMTCLRNTCILQRIG